MPVIALPEAISIVKVEPESTWISLLAANVISPDNVLESLTFRIAPLFETPVPLMVMASPMLMLLLKLRAAPDNIVVVPAVVPKALLCVAFITPALM